MRVGSVCLPGRLPPGHGVELKDDDVGRVLEAQATRSMILNRTGDMVAVGSIAPFRVPRKGSSH